MIYSLTTDRNFTNIIRNTPEELGPGSYEIAPKMGNKKKMKAPFGSRQERNLFPKPNTEQPAPGEYEAKPLGSSIVVSSVFQSESKRKVFTTKNTPSPADYGHVENWGKPQMSSRQMHCKRLKTPRPHSGFVGQDVECFTPNQNGAWIPIKKEKRGEEYVGPGSYTPVEFPTKYRCSLDSNVKREIFVNTEKVPDPCLYSPMKRSDKYPVAIRELSRSAPIDTGEPVFVNLKEWAVPQVETSSSFRNRERRQLFPEPEKTPSPVIYNRQPKSYFPPGHSFGVRTERKFFDTNTESPGPGAYDENTVKWIKGTSGTTPRAVSHVDYAESLRTPGPGSYIKLPQWKKSKRPSSVFQSRSKRSAGKIDSTPSGADYDPIINDKSKVVPQIIHESRFEKVGDWIENSKVETPAPDLYQNVELGPGKGLTIPYKYRDDNSDNKVPGPGAYNVVHASMKVKSFNSAVRNIPDD